MSLCAPLAVSARWLLCFGLLLIAISPSSAASTGQDSWYLQTSVYTRHFSHDPTHNERQELIGLERDRADGLLYGVATFRNSFRQRSVYAYGGKAWEHERWPVYAKLSAGLLHGYRGKYRDKLPLNRFGAAPVIIPAAGVRLGPVGVETVLLGGNAMMVNVGYRFR
ncbi:sn-glycerol-3-phosphate transporter [Pseudomonas sp. S75]|uniref:sn-glycerol-3-phosphate transporter n=1 Tax=unclassified Pseudomonas TaxID=196821 RepID=UPI00190829AD|nr:MULTISPECIES: sn-glycerol-3-phosphate transporter [unclassified Pseudomonas]MBJ9977365.1 sn-glycerol-3-phosphate transporter [Pseudomonas sp. S30]MBK0154823.1 sn-glycerol-3-phosphate transporter [Pseudomonas sp. S75]